MVERLGSSKPREVDAIWTEELQREGARQVGIVYNLRSRQAGVPTWFIAREHRYTLDLHWVNGVLLRERDGNAPATAMLIDDGREQPTITLRVSGRYPVRFLSVLSEAFENIVSTRYPGLIERRLVPCSCQGSSGSVCDYSFDLEELILEATDDDPEADGKVRCARSRLRIEARAMLDGLRGSGIARRLDKLNGVLDAQTTLLTRIDQSQLEALNGVRELLVARAGAGVHCPSLFEVREVSKGGALHRKHITLSLWCEWPYGPSGPHPLAGQSGTYTLKTLPKWLRDYLPFLRIISKTLGIVVPMVSPALTAAGAVLDDQDKSPFDLAEKILGDVAPLMRTEASAWADEPSVGPSSYAEINADFRALRNALRELDPQEVWGDLSAVPRPEDGRVVYLCREHVRALAFPYIEIPALD